MLDNGPDAKTQRDRMGNNTACWQMRVLAQ